MKRAATMLAVSLAVSSIVVACASMQPGGQDLVARAVQAQGGPEALGTVKTLSEKATVRQWEPEQSMVAGGEMRYANESTLESVTDVAARATRSDWVRNAQYPAPRTFTFTEIVTAQAGYVAGIDGNSRTKQSTESNPPAHSMSGLRLAAAQRELLRSSPLLTLEMHRNPDRVVPARSVTVGGVTYPAAGYKTGTRLSSSCSTPRPVCPPASGASTTTTSGATSPTTSCWATGRRRAASASPHRGTTS